MEITQARHETSFTEDISSVNTKSTVLSVAESAAIMRTMLSSIELEELINEYYKILSDKLPCTSLRLTFANQVLKTGVFNHHSRIMKISILYGHSFGAPQQAQLAYGFEKVLSTVQRKLLSEMHGIFAMSLKHALEYYRIIQLATKDVLTGLGNRAHYNESVKKLISISNRNQDIFGLLVFDLDNFKSVNDRYGHQEGDNVLIVFGQILKNCLRDSDSAFRFGGDEFCCLLLDATSSCNTNIAKRITKAVNSHELFKQYKVTVSVGATSFVSNDTAESLFERADQALYSAKQKGKNRVIAA